MATRKSKKASSRAAAKNTAQRKSRPRKIAAKSSARKKLAARGRAQARPGRVLRKQRVAISHHRDEDFKADGLRAYAKYRDLGIADATGGLARAHVIRLIGPCNPEEVSKLHFHDVDFQMVYVLKGWIKSEFDGQGAIVMRTGSCWIQPPRIEHKVLDYSDDCEVLEIILPADFKTVELE